MEILLVTESIGYLWSPSNWYHWLTWEFLYLANQTSSRFKEVWVNFIRNNVTGEEARESEYEERIVCFLMWIYVDVNDTFRNVRIVCWVIILSSIQVRYFMDLRYDEKKFNHKTENQYETSNLYSLLMQYFHNYKHQQYTNQEYRPGYFA